MDSKITLLLLVLIFNFCGNPKERDYQKIVETEVADDFQKSSEATKPNNTPKKELVESDKTPLEQSIDQTIITKAIILSVQEELIMPSDYLTTAMTVKTSANDTLVFLDMFNFEKLVEQEITIEYELIPGTKLLTCFDCKTYSGPFELFDITAFPSDVEFTFLKLKEYIPDPYIVPASTFIMIKEDGSIEEFYSNNNNLIADSIKMASSFYSYGVVTKMIPELKNRSELELLVK